eukprot:jgi/Hompol1/1622/HPOL_005082-RA
MAKETSRHHGGPVEIVSSVSRGRPKVAMLLQGVLCKKEETDLSGQRAKRRDWIRFWAILEDSVLMLYRYDKNMKGSTFTAASTARRLTPQTAPAAPAPTPATPAISDLSTNNQQPQHHHPAKSLDMLNSLSLSPTLSPHPTPLKPRQLSRFKDSGDAVSGSMSEGINNIGQPQTSAKASTSRSGWNLSDVSFGDLAFGSQKIRSNNSSKKNKKHSDRSSDTRYASSDLVERIAITTLTRVDVATDYVKRKHVFRVQPLDARSFLLRASSGHEMEFWIHAIQRSVDIVSVLEFELVVSFGC